MTKAVRGQLPADVHINGTDLVVLDQIDVRAGDAGGPAAAAIGCL